MRYHTLATVAAFSALSFLPGLRAEIDPKNFDLSVKPQDDFNLYANGGWMKANPIPPEQTSWGAFNEVDERNKANLRKILERVSAKTTGATAVEKIVGDFYATGMDEAAIDAAGIKPLAADLARIAALKNAAEVQAEIARFHQRAIRVPFLIASEPDPKNSSQVIAGFGQGGLGLPERDYYLRDDDKSKKLREQYVAHVTKLFELAGDSPADASAAAAAVMKLETALAKGSKTRVALRDPVANYNRMTEAEVQKLMPHFNWRAYFTAIGLATPGDLDIGQPEFFQAFDAQLEATPVAEWRAYLRWHLLHSSANYLGSAFVDENFAFYGKTLTGQQKLRERWKRVLQRVDGSVGEALGQLYTAEYFPAESKARMLKLVGNLQVALRVRLNTLAWMDEPTRAQALKKLDAFAVKIGYPDKWIDYGSAGIAHDSYVQNVWRGAAFGFRRDMAKVGKPVDRAEWEMTPPTVNAYYNPQLNEIVFPAGILQPPFFDPKADDAVNYGGIGAVIGHEMTHGFDDQGRQFDAVGNLADWWTVECAKRFTDRTGVIVKQFDSYVAVDDVHVNGALTTGENIADLGGLKIAYAALQTALKEKPAPEKIDGFTPAQRFFLSWASVWRTNMRPETARLYAQTDPHSPAKFRVVGPLSNLDEFAAAFAIPDGAPMKRPKAERVEIW
jgi:putative endopeptidase